MINSIEFYCGMSREMKALKCSEMCVKTDDMIELVSRLRYAESETDAILSMLRQAEKDAARYRWIKENGQLGVGRCGVDWELHFKGPAPDNSAKVERHIDEEIQCSK